ncbi:MAG: hypothetical protein M1378_00155 [Bacteroidetes bacterium]|nr:hypothetical protein [Bacteroidota bacterium]
MSKAITFDRFHGLPTITVKLAEPTSGYWDGGKKDTFEFVPTVLRDSKGRYVKWGSFSANFWFTCNFGRDAKDAVKIAKRHIRKYLKKPAELTVKENA